MVGFLRVHAEEEVNCNVHDYDRLIERDRTERLAYRLSQYTAKVSLWWG